MSGLTALARAYGVETWYVDWRGARVPASDEVLVQVLQALGAELSGPRGARAAFAAHERARWSELIEPVAVAWDGALGSVEAHLAPGRGPVQAELELEDGARRRWGLARRDLTVLHAGPEGRLKVELPLGGERLPAGYHRLRVAAGGETAEALVIAAPAAAWRPAGSPRRAGLFAPLYSLHSARSQGIGDLTDAAALAAWAHRRGVSVLATLPLCAAYLDEPCEPSPYAPVSRRFWNELYVDLATVAEAEPPFPPAPDGAALVDYRAVFAAKRAVLAAAAERFFARRSGPRRESYERFRQARPDLERYARFRAAAAEHGPDWARWPAPWRAGGAALDEVRGLDRAELRYHRFAQFCAHEQLAALAGELAGRGQGLWLDLTVGAHRHGFDVWADQEQFALAVNVGAPPDALFAGGQDWGFPPTAPEAARRGGHRWFVESLRRQLEHAALLRLDHVMGLRRLFWVPAGRSASEGVYVRYPQDELFAIVSLESHRAEAQVVGEDLGTVPTAVRRAMARHGLAGCRVLQFGLGAGPGGSPAAPPRRSVASLNTHDTPTFAGFCAAGDVDALTELGLYTPEQAEGARRARRAALEGAADSLGRPGAGPAELRDALHDTLAAGAAELVVANLEDLWLEPAPQNVPGTGPERPNWRRRAAKSIEEIEADADAGAALARLAVGRRHLS
ncbi:MAG: 4-alpha-glucanotransferase [Acidimicrobiales bacterium]